MLDVETAVRSYRSLGTFLGALDGNVSRRLVCVQLGMCLRVFSLKCKHCAVEKMF